MDLLGSTMSDGKNTWKDDIETSLALHASKFVIAGIELRKKKDGPSTKKSNPTTMSERVKHVRESSSSIFDKDNIGDEKYDRLWDEIKTLRSEVVTL